MKLNIDFKEKGFKDALIREIASQILSNEYNQSGVSRMAWDNPIRDALLKKAKKLLEQDRTG